MRAAHITSVHSAFDVRVFQKECRSLAAAGYEVTLVVPHFRNQVAEGVKIRAVQKPRTRLSRMTTATWRVFREAERQHADIYHLHDPELIPMGLLLRLAGKKVIYDIHEDVPRDILSKKYLPLWLRGLVASLAECIENTSSRFFSGLVAATPAIGERFNSLNGKTVDVCNFPLLHELSPPSGASWRARSFSVAYLGGITAERGIRELVAAMDVLPEGLNAALKLAGEFFPVSFGEELAHLPGWRRVEVLGLLDRGGLARTLRDVRAGLAPYLPVPNNIQAMPHKLFEYMSAGIPVIASDFPLWRRIIEDAGCGLLVDPSSPRAIADAIQFVLTRPQEAEAMGRRGREAVEKHYNWESEEKKLLQLYADLVKPSCAA